LSWRDILRSIYNNKFQRLVTGRWMAVIGKWQSLLFVGI
jgi:hypothetical protein